LSEPISDASASSGSRRTPSPRQGERIGIWRNASETDQIDHPLRLRASSPHDILSSGASPEAPKGGMIDESRNYGAAWQRRFLWSWFTPHGCEGQEMSICMEPADIENRVDGAVFGISPAFERCCNAQKR
jgi:hypothetical protein